MSKRHKKNKRKHNVKKRVQKGSSKFVPVDLFQLDDSIESLTIANKLTYANQMLRLYNQNKKPIGNFSVSEFKTAIEMSATYEIHPKDTGVVIIEFAEKLKKNGSSGTGCLTKYLAELPFAQLWIGLFPWISGVEDYPFIDFLIEKNILEYDDTSPGDSLNLTGFWINNSEVTSIFLVANSHVHRTHYISILFDLVHNELDALIFGYIISCCIVISRGVASAIHPIDSERSGIKNVGTTPLPAAGYSINESKTRCNSGQSTVKTDRHLRFQHLRKKNEACRIKQGVGMPEGKQLRWFEKNEYRVYSELNPLIFEEDLYRLEIRDIEPRKPGNWLAIKNWWRKSCKVRKDLELIQGVRKL